MPGAAAGAAAVNMPLPIFQRSLSWAHWHEV